MCREVEGDFPAYDKTERTSVDFPQPGGPETTTQGETGNF